MNEQHDYSPLQSLLLFQAVAACQSSAAVFDETSQKLRQSPLFVSDTSADDARFTPESLKTLYLKLAKEEARREINGSRASPRRKSPPPKDQKSDVEPHYGRRAAELVPHLYEKYREHAIREIKEEERKYESLSGELRGLSVGHDAAASNTSVAGKSSAQPSDAVNNLDPPGSAGSSKSQDQSAYVRGKNGHSPARFDAAASHDELSENAVSARARPSQNSTSSREPPSLASSYASASGPVVKAPLISSQSQSVGAQRPIVATSGSESVPPNQFEGPGSSVLPSQDLHSYGGSSIADENPGQPFSDSRRPHGAAHRTDVPSPYSHHPYQTGYHQSHGVARTSHQQPQKGGVMLPPFQIAPHLPSQSEQLVSEQPPIIPSNAGAHGKQAPSSVPLRHADATPAGTPLRKPAPNAYFTPLSGPSGSYLLKPGVSVSPGSTTGWKLSQDMPATERPRPRSVSPISDQEDAGAMSEPRPTRRARRGKKAETLQPLSISKRGQKAASVRTGSPSVRSQSTSSQVDESFRHPSALRYKADAPDSQNAPSVSGDETITPTTSRPLRRGNAKRKREPSVADTIPSVDDDLQPPPSPMVPFHQSPPSTVAATRNFNKIASTILNLISSHKHASRFADPVSDRMVEGYSDYIRRPQNLKSIRAAIKNGEKAVNAAAAATAEGSPGANPSSSTVILPVSDAIVPPKGIVNAAQLEQEIMRMFANAVMFNVGDGDIVHEAREMFVEVEREVQSWRSTEGVQDTLNTAAGEEDVQSGSKRRRL